MENTVIYIVRHGQAVGNKEGLLLGQSDTLLTKEGRRQAEIAADFFNGFSVDLIYSSDLKRAYETAEIIAKKLNKSVIKEPLLRERNIDTFKNLTLDQAKGKIKNLEEFSLLSDEEKLSYKFTPAMESGQDVVDRFERFIFKMGMENKGKTIIALTHGGLMLYYLISLKIEKYTGIFGDPNPFENLGYLKLETDGKSTKITGTKGYNPVNS